MSLSEEIEHPHMGWSGQHWNTILRVRGLAESANGTRASAALRWVHTRGQNLCRIFSLLGIKEPPSQKMCTFSSSGRPRDEKQAKDLQLRQLAWENNWLPLIFVLLCWQSVSNNATSQLHQGGASSQVSVQEAWSALHHQTHGHSNVGHHEVSNTIKPLGTTGGTSWGE